MILSFIVPCYNVELYVEKCIDSLENQDIPKDDYEILAYDDESKDNTLCVLEKLAKSIRMLKFLVTRIKAYLVQEIVVFERLKEILFGLLIVMIGLLKMFRKYTFINN